jgi:hypothetical protein
MVYIKLSPVMKRLLAFHYACSSHFMVIIFFTAIN